MIDPERFAYLLKLDGPVQSNFEGMSDDELVDAFFGVMDMTRWLDGKPEQTQEFKDGLAKLMREAGSRYALEQFLLNGIAAQNKAYVERKARDAIKADKAAAREAKRNGQNPTIPTA